MRLLVLLLFCLTLIAGAQTPASTNAAPLPLKPGGGAPLTPGYRLHPGDELEVDIFSLPALPKNYTVRVDGRFFHPFLGELEASGRTLDDLRFQVSQRLKKELKNPGFNVGLVNYARNEMTILGEVRSQGKVPFYHGTTLLDALALAGGLSEKADPETAVLMRAGRNTEIDLRPTGPASTMRVEAGDILYVQPGLQISVNGEVFKPGIYGISKRSPNPVAEALKAAGGAKTTAALGRVRISRPSLPAPLQVSLMPGAADPPPPLENGDALVLPERAVLVLGAVSKTGPNPLASDDAPLLDVLAGAGVNPNAKFDQIVVFRAADVKAGVDKREEYDLRPYLTEEKDDKKVAAAASVRVGDGDVVFVPAKAEQQGGLFTPANLFNMLILLRTLFVF